MRNCWPATACMHGCTARNSPPSASWFRRMRLRGMRESRAALGPPGAAQRAPARRLVLDDPALYPPRLRHEPLAGGGRGVAAPAAPRRARVHSRLLARPSDDDPDDVAAACPDAHADLGAPRRQ